MATIRFRYTEGIVSPDGSGGLQRHGLVHDIEVAGSVVTHLVLQAAERRFTTWFAAEKSNSRLIVWESGPTDGGVFSVYQCRLPADGPGVPAP